MLKNPHSRKNRKMANNGSRIGVQNQPPEPVIQQFTVAAPMNDVHLLTFAAAQLEGTAEERVRLAAEILAEAAVAVRTGAVSALVTSKLNEIAEQKKRAEAEAASAAENKPAEQDSETLTGPIVIDDEDNERKQVME